MEKLTHKIKSGSYLSDVIKVLPSNCIINKGVTGCGGTTLELTSKRDSIILCPTKNLVASKSSLGYFGVTGDVGVTEIRNYVMTEKSYKKIVATYDALEKLMKTIPNYSDYFLLIDEYHLLFNDYNFRSDAIMFVLNNFKSFKEWAFMTATPLKDEFILEELKDINQITYEWENSVVVRYEVKDTYFVQKDLLSLIDSYKDRNLHIFLNSVTTINNICSKLDESVFRVVCSDKSKTKVKNFSSITDPVRKINFYTSCAFEGCDIYDPKGYCIIVSDTNISTTILDISTKVRQVCGRLRDSIYNSEVTLVLNTNKHRYAGTTKKEFLQRVSDSEELGREKENMFKFYSPKALKAELKTFNKGTYGTIYLNKYNDKIFFDENLKKVDIYNYELISEIYKSSVTVLTEFANNNMQAVVSKPKKDIGLSWVINKLEELNRSEFTYQELENIFKPMFLEHNLKWNKNTTIKNFFPIHNKKQKMVNKKRETYYCFEL